jgi:hypothetical protein
MKTETPQIIQQPHFAQYDFSTLPNYYSITMVSGKPSAEDITNYCENLDIITEWCSQNELRLGFLLINAAGSISMPYSFNIEVGKFLKRYKASRKNTIVTGIYVFPNPMAKMVLRGISIISDFPFSTRIVSSKDEGIREMDNELRKAGLPT